MKRMLIFVVIGLLSMGSSLFANEAVLIDFSLLAADIHVPLNGDDADPNGTPNQNHRTMMDFGTIGGLAVGQFTPQQMAIMRTSLAIENWDVTLSPSSRTVQGNQLSLTRESPSVQFGTVMGVRAHFPTAAHNAWAMITPPFDIPAFDLSIVEEDGTLVADPDAIPGVSRTRFESLGNGQPAFGVVKNVGAIRSVAVRVHGLNFPHTLSVILIDHNGDRRTVPMGSLNFDGWRTLTWDNPNYIQDVRNRDLRLFPVYPFDTPFVKFGGFLIQRDANHTGGDFIGYFRDVAIIYDQAVLDAERDINDEAIWNIIRHREEARLLWEMQRFGQQHLNRFMEQQRQAQPSVGFTFDQPGGIGGGADE
ncbi:MAG: flagellar filament outer layer protein FlaA [Spirochaetes bacterium]|nr:flagellar filament outer layer protein FlaA [Spirochaetota bacterium]